MKKAVFPMFSRMYLDITTCCNLSCSFCPGTKRPAAFLSPEDFRTLAAKLRPFGQYLYLHVMGEPLLHPQLPELLEICRALGFRATLTTNGTLPPAASPTYFSATRRERPRADAPESPRSGRADPSSARRRDSRGRPAGAIRGGFARGERAAPLCRRCGYAERFGAR